MIPPQELCRNCEYAFCYHIEYTLVYPVYDIRKWVCTCKKFEPLDNLKYLEYKYEQKAIL